MAVGDNSVDLSLERELRNKPEQIIFPAELKEKEVFYRYNMSHSVWVPACALAPKKGVECVGRGFELVKLTPLHFQWQYCTWKREHPREIKSLCPRLASLQHLWVSVTLSHQLCRSHYDGSLAALHTHTHTHTHTVKHANKDLKHRFTPAQMLKPKELDF